MKDKQLNNILLKYSKQKDIEIPDDINLIEFLAIDSIDAMRILADIENEYGIDFDFEDINMKIFESKLNLITCIEKNK